MEDAHRPPRRSDDISIFTHNTTQTPGTPADGGGAVDILHGGPAAAVESPSTRPRLVLGTGDRGPEQCVHCVVHRCQHQSPLHTTPLRTRAGGRSERGAEHTGGHGTMWGNSVGNGNLGSVPTHVRHVCFPRELLQCEGLSWGTFFFPCLGAVQ